MEVYIIENLENTKIKHAYITVWLYPQDIFLEVKLLSQKILIFSDSHSNIGDKVSILSPILGIIDSF
jgi:hypothetical protein